MNTNDRSMPIVYIPHGGGPMPLLNDPDQRGITEFLSRLSPNIKTPEAILVISAHWEEPVPTILAGKHPGMLYDYFGFPAPAYDIQYPAPGDPDLAKQVSLAIQSRFTGCTLDHDRGYDHGVFVPLKLMYPQATIPVVQLSLLSSLDARQHLELGETIAALRKEGVLIIGSGFSFHNLGEMLGIGSDNAAERALEFDDWLVQTVTDVSLSDEQRNARLSDWEKAPHARFCHPREEHLLPLHCCVGAAQYKPAELNFHEEVYGTMISGFIWR